MNPSKRRSDKQFEVEDVFEYKGRTCVIVKVEMELELRKNPSITAPFLTLKSMYPFYNGYVEILDKRKRNFDGIIESEEITFTGKLDQYDDIELKGKVFAGFDTAHWYDMEHPERKTLQQVKERTIQFCEEMIAKGI